MVKDNADILTSPTNAVIRAVRVVPILHAAPPELMKSYWVGQVGETSTVEVGCMRLLKDPNLGIEPTGLFWLLSWAMCSWTISSVKMNPRPTASAYC